MVSYAPQSGSALAPTEPRAAAILLIEALAAARFTKPLSARRIDETENAVRDIIPPYRVPARPRRYTTVEFVYDKIVAPCPAL